MTRLFLFTNKNGAQGKCPEYIDKASRMTEIPWGKMRGFPKHGTRFLWSRNI